MMFERNRTKTWRGFLGKCIIVLALLFAWSLFVVSDVFAVADLRRNYPDVFAREDIHIESGKTIGRLLVTGGNATVSGVVEKGVLVVDGSLFLTPDAHIKGTVVVLGGYFSQADGARLESPVL